MAFIISSTIGDTASSTAFCACGKLCHLDGTDMSAWFALKRSWGKNMSFGVEKKIASKKRLTIEHYSQSFAILISLALPLSWLSCLVPAASLTAWSQLAALPLSQLQNFPGVIEACCMGLSHFSSALMLNSSKSTCKDLQRSAKFYACRLLRDLLWSTRLVAFQHCDIDLTYTLTYLK